jgi:protoheme ferro-lyase
MAIPNSSSDGLIMLAHGTPNVLGEMDTYLKVVTGGRGVPPEVVHELRERYAQIGLGDEPSAEVPTSLAGHYVKLHFSRNASERKCMWACGTGSPSSATSSKR